MFLSVIEYDAMPSGGITLDTLWALSSHATRWFVNREVKKGCVTAAVVSAWGRSLTSCWRNVCVHVRVCANDYILAIRWGKANERVILEKEEAKERASCVGAARGGMLLSRDLSFFLFFIIGVWSLLLWVDRHAIRNKQLLLKQFSYRRTIPDDLCYSFFHE